MRRHRVAGPLVCGTTTLLAAGAAIHFMAASAARADSNRHHRSVTTGAHSVGASRHRARLPLGSATIGVRVLPVPTAAAPPDNGQAEASNESDPAVSADVGSGGAHHSSSHAEHLGSGDQNQGVPRFTRPHGSGDRAHRRPRRGGHSPARHAPRPHRHGALHHGILPFTGRSMTISILGGATAVLTGAILLWSSSLRRRRRVGTRT
jgi:hypothetical protein